MKLNRHNYEEYFILYLDNELGSEDRREVELFAEENPDLKAELDILLQSKLTPDTGITFTNKESLLARDSSFINLNNYEEWLLSYIDNELTATETKDVERFITEHPAVKTELGLLQKTKLPFEAITFPGKESLYRKEEEAKVVVFHWRRWAVAAALLIGISTTAIVVMNTKPGKGQQGVAKGKSIEKVSTGNTPGKQTANEAPAPQEAIADNNPKKTEPAIKTPVKTVFDQTNNALKNEQSPAIKQDEEVVTNNTVKKKTNELPVPVDNPYTNRSADATGLIVKTDVPSKEALTNINEIATPSGVTPDIVRTSYSSNVSPEEGTDTDQPDGKKNKLRGFFRKITRTFEKRTNIKATDDEDRLLIAGLAIRLN